MKTKLNDCRAFTLYEVFVAFFALCVVGLVVFALWALIHFLAKFW